MPDTLHRLDVIHEARFTRPAVELAGEVPKVLRNFFDLISPHHPLSSEQISVSSANVLSDFLVRFSMYNNGAAVELRADRMSVRLQNINNLESVDIAKSLLTLSHEALAKTLPNIQLRETTFTGNSWFVLEGGASAAEQLLERNATPGSPLNPALWGAESIKYRLRSLSRNDSEGWTALLYVEPSLVKAANLFIVVEFTLQQKELRPIIDQISLFESKFRQIVIALGLRLPTEDAHD
jgi:hypothetical protein